MYSTLRGCEVRPLLICGKPISRSLSLKVCTCKRGPALLCRCGRTCVVCTVRVHFRGTTDKKLRIL